MSLLGLPSQAGSRIWLRREVARAEGTGQRVLYLEERPAFLAKNRYGMPPAIDLPTTAEAWREPQTIWAALAPYLLTGSSDCVRR